MSTYWSPSTQMIYRAAGAPPMAGDIAGTCRTCGSPGQGLLLVAWVRDTFTDHDKLTAGTIICHACQFCFADQNQALTARLGKDKHQRMRNYSHFVFRGEWIPLSKGDKLRMRTILLAVPDVAVVATSGQKHIIFRAQPGWWQIEEQSVRAFPAELARLLPLVEEIYGAGISKAEIESGRYQQRRLLDFGLARWREVESELKPLRGTVRLQLALFLAQKGYEGDTGRDSG